jgi:hypothetical protein
MAVYQPELGRILPAIRQCEHGYHHPSGSHSCDGCWCDDERDLAQYGWVHLTQEERDD